MAKNTVVETFNGLIPQMRKQGHTLQEIGETCGVSRERIRQILEKHYPNTKSLSTLLCETTAEELLGFRLEKKRLRGLVHPLRRGKHWLYGRNELEKAMQVHQHPCLMCGEVEVTGRKYCQKCVIVRRRNPYPFRSLEGKRKFVECCRRWQREHPERVAEIQRKATRAYLDREREKHFRETIYIVFRHCSLPIGTKFKAIGYQKPLLILISGIKIPVCCVRKTNARSKTI